jgi:asparagine synthase (glutamine-hydrolysing)
MCGICGFVGQGDEGALDHMLRRLQHRGPDEEGRYRDPGVMLGVRRLRVIDPEGGHQPVANETGTIRVVLNGEIYNYRELREELIRKGHRFTSNCDTEVLVHLYEEEGEDGVDRLRGMFAFALWDRQRETLLLVRDLMGIKPLYIAPLVFAGAPIVNAIVSLIWHPPADATDPKMLPGWLMFGAGILLAAIGAGLVLYSKGYIDQKAREAAKRKQAAVMAQAAPPP